MKDINDSNARIYVERFLAGETSGREEEALYSYFRRSDLPADLEPYREMFGWYASLCPAKARRDDKPALKLLKLKSWQWVSVAACLALLFSVGFIFRSPSEPMPDDYMAYEGSYIIRDGKKITDLRVVVPEIKRNEQLVNERLRQLDHSLEEANKAFDRVLSSDFDMSNPVIAEAVEATLRY